MCKLNVSQILDLRRLIETAVAKLGRVAIMVNNAGVEARTSVLDTTEAQYDKVLGINLKSAFFGTQLAAKQMIKQGNGGRIINITSVHEDWPMPGNTAYYVSKGGMRMLTRTAGVELAPHNILVVGVGPGAIAIPINLSTMTDPAFLGKLNSAHSAGPNGETGRNRHRRSLRCRRRCQLHHGYDHLLRRRHYAVWPRSFRGVTFYTDVTIDNHGRKERPG